MNPRIPDYGYRSAEATWDCGYVGEPILSRLTSLLPPRAKVLELGCGNGYFSGRLAARGYDVTAVDPSQSGIDAASRVFKDVVFQCVRAEDVTVNCFGRFDCVVSIEVIEHCYSPARLVQRAFELLRPGGRFLVSTPFHGYWKNLALAVAGRLDAHWNPLWEGGHIKFFSQRTLSRLLTDAGFVAIDFQRVGRWPPMLAKSMIACARRPGF